MTVRKHSGMFDTAAEGAILFLDGDGDLCTDTGNTYNGATGEALRSTDLATGITASTTQTQVGGTVLTKTYNLIGTCANDNDTVTMPPAVAGRHCIIMNPTAHTLKVYPASGDDCGGGVDTAVTQATTVNKHYYATDATTWRVIG